MVSTQHCFASSSAASTCTHDVSSSLCISLTACWAELAVTVAVMFRIHCDSVHLISLLQLFDATVCPKIYSVCEIYSGTTCTYVVQCRVLWCSRCQWRRKWMNVLLTVCIAVWTLSYLCDTHTQTAEQLKSCQSLYNTIQLETRQMYCAIIHFSFVCHHAKCHRDILNFSPHFFTICSTINTCLDDGMSVCGADERKKHDCDTRETCWRTNII